ncbi:MAG: hypothetical protein AUJ98_09200 [Bacteroidetes bacterium CG2_30_33_31]|nr:MAG: hypothetical protein AUJ98_09200 [Bacteroidetes bacterium CG2_30_33_31]
MGLFNSSGKKLILIAFLIAFGSVFIFSSCRKEKSMTLTITVKMMSDTNAVVPNAKVVLNKEDIHIEGYTDALGQFRHSFNLQIQLDVTVTKDTLSGIGIVNLGNLGTDVEKSIYIF